ncbi:MAG: imidazole glycerol phosphate synthase cyclase subunit [Candidatus Nitrosocaldaceae archaeon]|nr:MAG: imidazole glycerol phosphate synthase cyclase subunit [Candidatus Nitrosocaldaceae archaeon]
MIAKRIIPCLDVDNGRVVKGISFKSIKDAGDPVLLAEEYSKEGADELVFLDITASEQGRETMKHIVREVAKVINIPFTVGGGIKSLDDARSILLNGADKVSINTAAVKKPSLIKDLMQIYGKQCVVVAIDAKRNYNNGKNMINTKEGRCWFEVYIYGGKKATGIDAIEWAKKAEKLGAGEILLTSIDKDGTKDGYDLDLTKAISKAVNIPIIASGGCGKPKHMLDVFKYGKADAALAASIFHYKEYSIPNVKRYLKRHGIRVRI